MASKLVQKLPGQELTIPGTHTRYVSLNRVLLMFLGRNLQYHQLPPSHRTVCMPTMMQQDSKEYFSSAPINQYSQRLKLTECDR